MEEPFSEATSFANVQSDQVDSDPWLSEDRRQLYFASTRDSKRDLYWTNRAAPDGEFATPTPIVELNTDSREEDPWLSRDQGLIMFMSERSGYRKPLHVDALTGAGGHATRSSHAPHAEPLQASVHEQLERQRNPARLDGTAGRLPAFCASRLTRDGFVLPRTNVRPQSLALGRNASRHARARPDRQQQTQDWHQGDLSHVE